MRWALLGVAGALSEGGVRDASVILDADHAGKAEAFRVEESSCRRAKCNGERPNLIVPWELLEGHQAGINDRASVMIELGDLAAGLCANVAVGRPCDLLGNHGSPVPCGAAWARYRAVVMKDGSPNVLLEGGEPSEYSDAACKAAGGRACIRGGAEQLPAVLAALKSGQPFTWFWGTAGCRGNCSESNFFNAYYAVGRALVENEAVRAERESVGLEWPSCSSVELVPSDEVAAARDAALHALGLAPGKYSTFHIRRGDTLGMKTVVPEEQMPDTTVAAMVQLARTQIVPKVQSGAIPPAVLVFSDETDKAYLAELQQGLRGLGLEPHLGDDAVRAATDKAADNMFVFTVDKALGLQAAERFRCDRGSFGPFGDHLGIIRGDTSL